MKPIGGPVVDAARMRATEIASGVSLGELMDRAGAAVREIGWRLSGGAPVLVLCGTGNNGGDGYVAARLLAARGASVRVAASAPPATDLARSARAAWHGEVEAFGREEAAPIVVDALFGIGMSRPLDDATRTALVRARRSACLTIAVDLPSGVGSDDGADLGAAGADVTIALGAVKPAHLLLPAAARCGRVVVADLGLVITSRWQVLGRPCLRAPSVDDHKYTRGLVAVVQGAMPGAAALAAQAAAHAGAGYVVLVGDDPRLPRAIVVRPADQIDEVLRDIRTRAVVVGPGLGQGGEGLLARVLASDRRVVIDGDALRDGLAPRAAATILTPHAGEFARMFRHLRGSKLDRTRAATQASGATIVHKGADTVIASPDGRATLAPAAAPWLATAGTGDVLAGICGAMLARGLPPHEAAEAAVWLHGEAARRAGPALIADDLLARLAPAVAEATRR